MSNWTTVPQLKAQVERLWERGELLRHMVTGDHGAFPLRLRLRAPNSTDIGERFEQVRTWVAGIRACPWLHIEWREHRHRVQGAQMLPASVWLQTPEDALGWLGRLREQEIFGKITELTRNTQAKLLPWLAKRPLQGLELAGQWQQLLDLVAWMQAHPRPGIYMRQVDLPGVHSKFIEAHRAVLAELLDLVLPDCALDQAQRGIGGFAARYGFRDKPVRVRMRVLDPEIRIIPGPSMPDLTLDSASFGQLPIRPGRVFITENEINFLSFPRVAGAIVIFGAGYGWSALAGCRWLHACDIHYWGDIDTHGFGILDQLRAHFPQARSLLMDRSTLLAHEAYWGVEETPLRAELRRLRDDEQALYDTLRNDEIRVGLRLEQEYVGYDWLLDRLHGPGDAG